jgi:hypothetical protein
MFQHLVFTNNSAARQLTMNQPCQESTADKNGLGFGG